MSSAWVIGVASTGFKKWPDRSFRDLTSQVVHEVIDDTGFDAGDRVESVHFGNCGMAEWGQANIRGQACLLPLMRDGVIPDRAPITNVEGGCATGSLAFLGAVKDVLSGAADVSMAVGVEKVIFPNDLMKTVALFKGGVDQMHAEDWIPYFEAIGETTGHPLVRAPHRILFLDTYAMQANHHMSQFGTTVEDFARVASKNHHHGTLNPKAQYRFEVSVEAALSDKSAAGVLTRSMCCPLSDGAAAAIVCTEQVLAELPAEVRERAIRVCGTGLAGGRMRALDEPGVTAAAADMAYRRAGLGPDDVDVVELHDSTSYCEIAHSEALGFAAVGQGAALARSGETGLGGRLPINPSGGLISKGHPLAATGLGMIDELVLQLRGEAGDRQVEGAGVGLQQNAGGLIGLDEALCSVILLSRA